MDIRPDGLTVLWLRVLWLANHEQRLKVNKFHDAWIKQVKLSEAAILAASEQD